MTKLIAPSAEPEVAVTLTAAEIAPTGICGQAVRRSIVRRAEPTTNWPPEPPLRESKARQGAMLQKRVTPAAGVHSAHEKVPGATPRRAGSRRWNPQSGAV